MSATEDTVRLSRPDLTREKLIAQLRDLRPTLERKGVSHLALFGSRARDENRPDSDIDVLAEVFPGRKFSGFDLAGIGLVIEDHFGLSASLLMRRSLDERFRSEIGQDVIEIF